MRFEREISYKHSWEGISQSNSITIERLTEKNSHLQTLKNTMSSDILILVS